MIRNYMIRLKENSVSFSGWDRRGCTVFFCELFFVIWPEEETEAGRNRMTLPDCHDRIVSECAGDQMNAAGRPGLAASENIRE